MSSTPDLGSLPWGWWLRADANRFQDAEGRSWCSVRDAFWLGELGFPATHLAEEQLELLLRVLTAINFRWVGGAESRNDLFDGDMLFWRFYMSWLSSVDLLDHNSMRHIGIIHSALEAPLSDKGRSVMLMLQATRQPDWVLLPMREVVSAIREAELDHLDHAREDAMQAFERSVGQLRYVFARERINGAHLVTLTAMVAEARMPTFRIVWSQSFSDQRLRDDFFAWLAHRVDRWADWGAITCRKGAAALSQHLLALLVAEPSTRQSMIVRSLQG